MTAFRRRNHFLGGVLHPVRYDEIQSRVAKDLLRLLDIRAFQTNNNRHLHANGLCRFNDTGVNDIATHDSAKNIDEYRLDVLVRQKDPKCIPHLLSRCAASDIEEVRGTASGQFDDVHCRHCQARAVHHACHVAVELDIVQSELARFDFQRIFFVQVAQFLDIFMPVERIVIEVHFRVQRVDFVVAGDEEGIDFGKRRVHVFKRLVQADHELRRIVNQLRSQTQTKSKPARLKGLDPESGFDVFLQDEIGTFGSNFFDVHTAGRRSHEYGFSYLAIDHDSKVKLFADIESFLDKDLLHPPAFRSRLGRHQVHAKHPAGDFGRLVGRFRQLHSSAFSSSPRMNLSLHYDCSAYPLCNLPCFLFRVRDLTARNPHVIARQNLLGLVFVYLHDRLKKKLESANWTIYRLGRERVNARTQRVRVQFSSAMRCVKIFILLAIFTPRDYIFTSADYSHAKRSEVQKPGLVLGPVATSRKMGVRANGFWC